MWMKYTYSISRKGILVQRRKQILKIETTLRLCTNIPLRETE